MDASAHATAPAPTRPVAATAHDVDALLETCLAWARERDYAGYDPYDGLNSRLLAPLGVNWLARLVITHGIKNAPINLRPYLGVAPERNPKGIALFARCYLDRFAVSEDDAHLVEAEALLEWLGRHRSPAFERASWGYNFDWQMGRGRLLRAHHPSLVVTTFCGEAFLRHHRLTGEPRSLAVAEEAARFIMHDINTVEADGRKVLAYTPYWDYVAINANALAARFLRAVGRRVGDGALERRADELFGFLLDTQTDEGAWYYAYPREDSHLTHDNFHTGYVLESLHPYATDHGPDSRPWRAYEAGMRFYRSALFEADGAPKFAHDRATPYDVHGAAQGIITFLQRGRPADVRLAERVLDWTLANLYDAAGYFFRRRSRVRVDTTPYMRWSQAWMCVALAAIERFNTGARDPSGTP